MPDGVGHGQGHAGGQEGAQRGGNGRGDSRDSRDSGDAGSEGRNGRSHSAAGHDRNESEPALRVEVYRRDPRAIMPVYKTSGAAAFDLSALDDRTIAPGETARVATGLVVKVPDGYFLGVFARSGTAARGLALGNGVGVIDADYCGPDDELSVLVRNAGDAPFAIEAGMRIAQGIVLRCPRVDLVEMPRPEAANRGGFGSTGQ